MLSKNAIYLLEKRYCKAGETPEDVFKRVAEFLSEGDLKFEEKLFDAMINGIFLPNSPCLFNAGTKYNFLHACFTLPIEDDINSIFKCMSDMAYIFKTGGGVGINFSPLREKGATLSQGGTSSGVISFMGLFDKVVDTVKQGGVRRGALMGVLNYDHPDILDFIRAKLEGHLQNFNLSIMVTDDFMKAVKKGNGTVKLKSPKGYYTNEIGAKDLFEVASFAAWCNGDPAFLFFDTINKNPKLIEKGLVVKATNPCQPAGSLLFDEDRLVPIEDGGKTWKSFKSGVKKVIKLICNNGMELYFTPEHKIQLDNSTFVEAKDTLNKNLKWGLCNRKATTIHSEDCLLGFLFGDGFLCHKGKDVSVRINEFKEKEVVDLLVKHGFYKKADGAYYIQKGQLSNIEFLNQNFRKRTIPKSILVADSDTVAGFLRGLFEAIGNVDVNSTISLKVPNKKVALDVQLLLASFGIPSWVVKNLESWIDWNSGSCKVEKVYMLKISPRSSRLFKEKIGFISSAKNSRIKEFSKPDLMPLKVIDIKEVGEMEVWDYTMNNPPDYNFCQGVIAKNCSESPLPDYGACCLGSINLSKFVWKNNFNFDKFADYCKLAMRTLSAMNKLGEYPLPQIKAFMSEFNPVGCGVMGFADTLIKLGIYYDSEDCLKFIDEVGKVYMEATESYNPNTFYLYRRILAPTGSLSILADCSSGIEPVYDVTFERRLTVGVIEETRDLYKSKYVRTAIEISPEWHVKVLARWAKWTDGGISKTVTVPYTASVDDIKNIYLKAWELGCKGVTVFRNNSRADQPWKSVSKKPSIKCGDETCAL